MTAVTAQRPPLRAVPLADVLPARPGQCYITASPGQWDALLAMAYDANWVLLEIGDDGVTPVRAYMRPQPWETN